MARRKAQSRVEKTNYYRPPHVQGKSDVLYKVFSCLNPDCQNLLKAESSEVEGDFSIECDMCGHDHNSNSYYSIYDYEVTDTEGDVVRSGQADISHSDYIDSAADFKYCIICGTLKPLSEFGFHSARVNTGRQGECSTCKDMYNGIKNDTRTSDQHREASDRRRTYNLLSGDSYAIDGAEVYNKFDGKCFNCESHLKIDSQGRGNIALDHTLPAKLLWPRTTDNATLLCDHTVNGCNGSKGQRWPKDFYKSSTKLKSLATLTGFPYEILAGDPAINPDAVKYILDNLDDVKNQLIDKPGELDRIRGLIIKHEGVDILGGQ